MVRTIKRVAGLLGYYVRGIFRGIVAEDVFLWCGAIAFKVLITLVPLVVLAAGVFGLVLRQGDILLTIENFILAFAPSFQSREITELLLSFSEKGETVTLIGSAGLLFTIVTLFTTLRTIVGNVFKGTHHRRPIVQGYLLDIGLASLGGALFLLTFGLTLGLDIVDATGSQILDRLGLSHELTMLVWGHIGKAVEWLVPPVLSALLFFQLFYFIPLPRPHAASALVGAFTTTLLWEVAKRVFTFYAVEVGTFERYSGIGTLGLIVGLVFWTYYSGLVFIIGAMVTAIHDERVYEGEWSIRSRMAAQPTSASEPEDTPHEVVDSDDSP